MLKLWLQRGYYKIYEWGQFLDTMKLIMLLKNKQINKKNTYINASVKPPV